MYCSRRSCLSALQQRPRLKSTIFAGIVGVVIILLMGAFPPWKHTFKASTTYSETDAGYSLILSPPPAKGQSYRQGIKIDITRLIIQWAITIIATAAGILLSAEKKKEFPLKQNQEVDYEDLLKKYREEKAKKKQKQ